MSVPASKNIWRALAVISALVFVYASVLTKLAHDWWVDENYSHGLLIPFVIGYILWAEREKLRRSVGNRRRTQRVSHNSLKPQSDAIYILKDS